MSRTGLGSTHETSRRVPLGGRVEGGVKTAMLLRHSMNSMFLLFFGFLSHFPCFVRDAPIGPVRRGRTAGGAISRTADSARH